MKADRTDFRLEQGDPLALLIYEQPFTLTDRGRTVPRA